ncbi:MAG TPA: hypothetical protein VHM70_03190 [Polyangiaceae bacterium]|nr:hypothetical protein [Polyangiaceae bacterium]
MYFRESWLAVLTLALPSCAPRTALEAREPWGQEVLRSPDSVALRTERAEYSVHFARDPRRGTCYVMVTTEASPPLLADRIPVWVELQAGAQRYRLERIVQRADQEVEHEGKFVCVGVLSTKCGRPTMLTHRYTWQYVLPPEATSQLARLASGRVTLAVLGVALSHELESEEQEWISRFFAQSSS